jgi:hypothetical protein
MESMSEEFIELNGINATAFLRIYTNICLCNMHNGKQVVLCVLDIGID